MPAHSDRPPRPAPVRPAVNVQLGKAPDGSVVLQVAAPPALSITLVLSPAEARLLRQGIDSLVGRVELP